MNQEQFIGWLKGQLDLCKLAENVATEQSDLDYQYGGSEALEEVLFMFKGVA